MNTIKLPKMDVVKPSIYAMNNVAFNLITHGGLLLALFLVVYNDSFYPVEAFIFPFLLAKYLGPLISRMNPDVCLDTVTLTTVLMSMLLFLQDTTVPDSEKTLFGISLASKDRQQVVFVLILLLLASHIMECLWKKSRTLPQILSGLVIGGFIGYTGFSMCRTRDDNETLLWFASRWVLVILMIFLIVSYVMTMLQKKVVA